MTKTGLKIAMGADHAGYHLKEKLKSYLISKGYEVTDYGTHSDQSSDYADFAHPVAETISSAGHDLGLVMCGSGNGVNMTVNKHPAIRSALCWTAELARLARAHNDANVLALPARFISEETALEIVRVFLSTDFDGGRHCQRIAKIPRSK
ncbi:MAG: ribose 5-phosphate isomerase B [Bacteroidales bacterium]